MRLTYSLPLLKLGATVEEEIQLEQKLALGGTYKTDGKGKVDTSYSGRLLTAEKHKLYFEHTLAFDLKHAKPLTNSFTINVQDSNSIGTLNTHM